jgi:hypothetical protein
MTSKANGGEMPPESRSFPGQVRKDGKNGKRISLEGSMRTLSSGLRFTASFIALASLVSAAATAQSWKTDGVHALPNIGLSEFLFQELGLEDIIDHGIDLGGIGSDLWHGPGDGPGIYWMITDRGPNGDEPRTFPVPEFTPFILKVRATNGTIQILDSIPITGWDAATRDGVTGIPNLNNTTPPPALNERFYNCFGTTSPYGEELDPNPHGLDTEGLVRTVDGTFWVVEEYGPSLLKIDPQGRVLKRFLPDNLTSYMAPITGYATVDSPLSVPEIYGLRRRLNRGFEGIALTPNGRTLYIALQSPFLTPTGNTGRDSRNTRILAFDIAREEVVGEYVYPFQPHAEFNVANQPTPPFDANRARDMKVSALAMLDQHRMLVLERTDFIAKVFLVDFRKATNILGAGKWDDPTATTAESLEAVTNFVTASITPLPKTLVATLDSTVSIRGMEIPQKIEGLAILDGQTIAVANDNDFGAGSFTIAGPVCTLNDTGRESEIIVIRLDEPIK